MLVGLLQVRKGWRLMELKKEVGIVEIEKAGSFW
jgi:hypothetical protein